METKLCRKCNVEKNIDNFRLKKDKCGKYYRYSYCKECEKNFLILNRKRYDKTYRDNHKEEIKSKAKLRNENLSLEEKEKQKEYFKKYMVSWRKNNKDKIKAYYMKDNKKRKENSFLHFKDQIRHEILRSFKSKGKIKNYHTKDIVGIDLDKLYFYLKKTYKNNYGIEWDGIEKVHIDHIIPLSTANTEEEIIELCHYTNLQLLKEKDNLRKYNKLNWELK